MVHILHIGLSHCKLIVRHHVHAIAHGAHTHILHIGLSHCKLIVRHHVHAIPHGAHTAHRLITL